MRSNHQQVVVGLSGGVDSSAALILLKKKGFEPVGVSLKYDIWPSKKNLLKENICCSQKSLAAARKICRKLKVPYHVIEAKVDFKKKVIGYFLSFLKDKRTPNPCLVCNKLVKFKKLFEFAEKKGIDYVATGHYARINKSQKGSFQLLRAKDKKKDQSYFLCLLNQRELRKLIFPLGNYNKKEVYQIVRQEGFNFFVKKKQSQDLCFIDQKSLLDFLKEKIGRQPGDIVDEKSRVLGQHQGLHFYTIGQRKGIGLSGGPWWVAGFDKKKNQLIVTNKDDNSILFSRRILITDYHFVSGQAPQKAMRIEAKVRFNQKLSKAKLCPPKRGKLEIIFDRRQKAVAPGQWAVFYQKDVCLGGGIIERAS